MEPSAITNSYTAWINAAHKTQNTQSVTSTQKEQATGQLPVSVKPKTSDTVTISSRALTLLANSKGYSPTEEANEPGYEKAAEKRLGQR